MAEAQNKKQDEGAGVQEQPKRNVDQFGKPLRRVKFMNNEDPALDLPFSFQPQGGEMEKYHLYPGYEYELPDYIVKHLNNLEYPTYQTQFDERTGQTNHVRAGSFNRVTCHPVE